MRQSHLFGGTLRNIPKDEVSTNAQLLLRAGFIDKVGAGIYTYLPLGLRTLTKIQNCIRVAMDAIGAQEIRMPALHPSEPWERTGRWSDPGTEVMFQMDGRDNHRYGLGWTHEEIVTPLVKKVTVSYKDLPVAVYQIQDKFRNEPRAKSGLLRGREFNMKDLYSFHLTEEDLDVFYQMVIGSYDKILRQLGLEALLTEASGGAFSKFSHEFQVPTEYGEDIVFSCVCGRNQNKEIVSGAECPSCHAERQQIKAIEIGNIFKLGRRFTDAFGFTVQNKDGAIQPVFMGCYGFGPSRALATIVEIHHDERGIIWPHAVAPYHIHVIGLPKNENEREQIEYIYIKLIEQGHEILFDDRFEQSAGKRFADADLIGIPKRIIISSKTLADNAVEVLDRMTGKTQKVSLSELI